VNDHAVTGKAAREELVGGAPEVEAETSIVEFAKAGDDGIAIAIEVARPLQGGVKVAVPVVEQIMPGLSVNVAPTREEAVVKFEVLQDMIVPETGIELLSQRLGHDLSGCDVNDPLPVFPISDIGGSRAQIMVDAARRNNFTIRDLYRHIAGARGHYQVSGTPNDVADLMEQWVAEEACDGFNVMPPPFPNSLREFVDLVIPELQRRGLFRKHYEATTLRGNLGLTRPPWSAAGVAKSRPDSMKRAV
jgi:hypothetical protein